MALTLIHSIQLIVPLRQHCVDALVTCLHVCHEGQVQDRSTQVLVGTPGGVVHRLAAHKGGLIPSKYVVQHGVSD